MSPNFGVSFSIKQCRNFKIAPKTTLRWLVKEVGFQRLRLMSYWNEHERTKGEYDFTQLDWQIRFAQKYNCEITLCLGARQPRWPENHWPDWAWQATPEERSQALMKYLEVVVNRYKSSSAITSWQLENEALLTNFGEKSEVDRTRLSREFELVKQLDTRPIIMTTSTSWGIPLRQPIPDIIGFSFYNITFDKGEYRRSLYQPSIFKARAVAIKLLHGKTSFIHELQAEPWGPKAIWEMSQQEQNKSMSIIQLQKNLALAQQTQLHPIDLWGGEWWYWQKLKGNHQYYQVVRDALTSDAVY